METEKRLQKLKNKSRIISALLCICMLLCICSCTNEAVPITEEPNSPGQSENVTETKAPKDTTDYSEHSFAVHYIDVGQGDAEREEEQEILNAGYDLSATVLKVGHHGSKNSTTYPFLREIIPKYAVISVGDNNYGHPTEDTLSRLRDADVKVYRTDIQGDIIAISDGKNITITTKKNENAQTNPTENEKSTSAQSTENAANQEICEYIGNANTKKFHYPDCGAVSQMKEKNKVYLNCTRDEAIKDGYNPCGRCNP